MKGFGGCGHEAAIPSNTVLPHEVISVMKTA